ncbi:MAG: hypothetical protein ABIJ41_03705 [Candidatus Omnitrophota bacterium]
MKIFLNLFICIWLCIFCHAPLSRAQEVQDTIAYKLAKIHTANENIQDVFLKNKIEPAPAIIAEFQWILSSLRNRCFNPENAIADTIMEAWQIMRNWGYTDMTLLDIARDLSQVANNKVLFGFGKVNFRTTTNFWLSQQTQKE